MFSGYELVLFSDV